MCSPVLAVVVGLQVAGTVATAYQQRQQGKYEKSVADYNARVLENDATRVRNISVERENDLRQRTAQLVSKQRAQAGASGIDVDSGSAFKLQQDAAVLGEADALRLRRNFDDKASSVENQATFTRAAGVAAEKQGNQRAIGTLLSGAGNIGSTIVGSGVADKWFTADSSANVQV